MYRGTAPSFHGRGWDEERKIWRLTKEQDQPSGFPFLVGNMTVGTVIEAGENVEAWKPGDRVFGGLGLRETHTVPVPG